jgi:hypothetical protein
VYPSIAFGGVSTFAPPPCLMPEHVIDLLEYNLGNHRPVVVGPSSYFWVKQMDERSLIQGTCFLKDSADVVFERLNVLLRRFGKKS